MNHHTIAHCRNVFSMPKSSAHAQKVCRYKKFVVFPSSSFLQQYSRVSSPQEASPLVQSRGKMTEESKELTVLHNIVSNFKKYPWKTAFAWLDKNCEIVSSISYKELGLVTEDIATELLKVTSEGNYSSKTVVLCYTPGPEFITAFLGCLRAGLIPGVLPRASSSYLEVTIVS